MNNEPTMALLTSLVGLGVMIMLAGIPWAYSIHGRLTKIETSLKDRLIDTRQITDIEKRLTRLELQHEST